MPYPYLAIPQLHVWQNDSTTIWGKRASDALVSIIDNYVEAYHNPLLVNKQVETLFYLRMGLQFWIKKLNAVPKNLAPTGMNVQNLPATPKVSGTSGRTEAMKELLLIVNSELRTLFNVASDKALDIELKETYGVLNHGVLADQTWMNTYGGNPNITTVFLTNEGIQRQNKLRFRDGIAWRWNKLQNTYTRYDSTDNSESESNDQMVHFVMEQKGRIYAGFDKSADWFKHTSLVGGANGYAAGRMKVQNGVIMVIENDSGHFAPNHQQMRNILQRLRLYGASVAQTVIKRNSDKTLFTSAQVMLAASAWPDGQVGH